MRERDRVFVGHLTEAAADDGSGLTDKVKVEAVSRTWQGAYGLDWHATPEKRARAIRKANSKLANPNIQEALRDVFLFAADFSVIEALRLQVAHARGTLVAEKVEIVDKETGERNLVNVHIPPNYQATKDILGMMLPQAAKKIDTRSQVMNVPAPPAREGSPGMQARVMGAVVSPRAALPKGEED